MVHPMDLDAFNGQRNCGRHVSGTCEPLSNLLPGYLGICLGIILLGTLTRVEQPKGFVNATVDTRI